MSSKSILPLAFFIGVLTLSAFAGCAREASNKKSEVFEGQSFSSSEKEALESVLNGGNLNIVPSVLVEKEVAVDQKVQGERPEKEQEKGQPNP
jgi:hypothetical protein